MKLWYSVVIFVLLLNAELITAFKVTFLTKRTGSKIGLVDGY